VTRYLTVNLHTELRIGPQGVAWKPLEGEGDAKSVMVQATDIKWAEWLRVARNFQLRIGLKEKGKRVTFDGFVKEVSSYFRGCVWPQVHMPAIVTGA
jgi:POB3-like N-terminal PH domain